MPTQPSDTRAYWHRWYVTFEGPPSNIIVLLNRMSETSASHLARRWGDALHAESITLKNAQRLQGTKK